MDVLITLVLIVITMVISWAAMRHKRVAHRLVFWPPAIYYEHQYDRLLMHGFIHADVKHLLFNMVTLFCFGQPIEQMMTQITHNHWVYLFFYLSAIIVSILPSYLKNYNNPNHLSLGASGAISAIMTAYVMIHPWSLIFIIIIPVPAIVYLVCYVIYSVWMNHRGDAQINHSAHMAGAIFAILFLLCLDPRFASVFATQLLHP